MIQSRAPDSPVQTFKIAQDADGNFGGFVLDANGNLIIISQDVPSGFRLVMSGKLVAASVLEIDGFFSLIIDGSGLTMSVARLSQRVRRELTWLSEPSRAWMVPHHRDGARVLDVLIVGAGQGGLATAFGEFHDQIIRLSGF